MPNPYELTALEDPADMYNELPRGGGRIAFPSGDVRTFQFEPPTPEDQNAALRAAAARADIFDLLQRNAQEAAKDRQEMADLQANLRVENAAKAVQFAERFQAMRAYQRDVQEGEAEGLTPAGAGARAGARNPLALAGGGGSGAAAMYRAATEEADRDFVPREFPTGMKGVKTWITRAGGLTSVRETPEKPEIVPPLTKAKSAVLVARITGLQSSLADSFLSEPKRADLEAKLATAERELEALYPQTSPPAAAATPETPTTTAGSVAGADSVFNSSSEARAAGYGKGDKVRIKGVGIVRLR